MSRRHDYVYHSSHVLRSTEILAIHYLGGISAFRRSSTTLAISSILRASGKEAVLYQVPNPSRSDDRSVRIGIEKHRQLRWPALEYLTMRALALLTTISALAPTAYSLADAEPETHPYLSTLSGRSANPLLLFKRQSCPTDHTSCSAVGSAGSCCPNDTNCALDPNGNVACCPKNAVCTGVISGSAPASTGSSSTSGFVLGTSSTPSSPSPTAGATLAPGYSTVPNQYYPFVLIPTSYPNSQECQSAYSTCQSASTACLNSLAGQNGVTISGIGSLGVTQAGVTGALASSASSICNSLYQEGCYGLQSTVCNQFGSGTGVATQTTGFVQVNEGPAAVARCTGALYTAAAAAVAGAGVARMAMI